MISTRDLSDLPPPNELERLLQAMAMLDAILEAEWQYRYYSFNARWSPTERMGSMRDGCGDALFAVFDGNGCFLKGFAHEASMSPYRTDPSCLWPGVLDNVPGQFEASLREPAFKMSDTTFCIWRRPTDTDWSCGPLSYPPGADPDGSASLLSPFEGLPETHRTWAEQYYEKDILLDTVSQIFQHAPITEAHLEALGCTRTLSEVLEEALEIGYPVNE